jgi:hypothetical protein
MPQYLVAIHLPDDFDTSSVDKAMEHDIDVLNEEMEAKGLRLLAGGLRPARDAKSLRAQPDGKVVITDGPYLETKEHVGGFWILEAAESGRGTGMGTQGRCRLSGVVRGAPVFSVEHPNEIVFTAPAAGEQKPMFKETA